MKNKQIDNAKLGVFVLTGVLFLIFTLYMIGKNRNLLGSTFTIKAVVGNVNGLLPGNNVRFKGIDVGTVKSIAVENDTAIIVTMLIDMKMKPHIRKNAIASIGTDGLMGSKLININSQAGESMPIEKGDIIYSRSPVETDEMLRTLNTTNNNIERITANLYEITVKLNNSKSLWSLLADTSVTTDLKTAVVEFKNAGTRTAEITLKGKKLISRLEQGDGLVQKLFTDSALSNQLARSVNELRNTSDQSSQIMEHLKIVVDDLKNGQGTAGLLLADTSLRRSLFKTGLNIEEGTNRFNQNMEALRSNFLFRRYFRKLEKEQTEIIKAKKE